MMEYGGNKMFIQKNYNVKSLAETLEGALSVALDDGKIVVEIGLLEASEILDVLNETNKREQKHQTLESACNFMEMEDGAQTNEMELHNKKDANGNILRGMDCFGCHIAGDGKCNLCIHERECMNETKEECEKRKGRNEILCDDCLMSGCCTVDCTNEHITEQMLGDLKKCFGKYYGKRPIIVCGTCKYKYQCEVLTKHE